MTRINLIDPRDLTNKHLVAEYRELPRVFGMMKRRQLAGKHPVGLPTSFRLGTGHVLFFLDKGAWLVRRQHSLIDEMLRRNYRPKYLSAVELAAGLGEGWMGDWEPTADDIALSQSRIDDRLANPKPRKIRK